jgi:hypothetical protein
VVYYCGHLGRISPFASTCISLSRFGEYHTNGPLLPCIERARKDPASCRNARHHFSRESGGVIACSAGHHLVQLIDNAPPHQKCATNCDMAAVHIAGKAYLLKVFSTLAMPSFTLPSTSGAAVAAAAAGSLCMPNTEPLTLIDDTQRHQADQPVARHSPTLAALLTLFRSDGCPRFMVRERLRAFGQPKRGGAHCLAFHARSVHGRPLRSPVDQQGPLCSTHMPLLPKLALH